MNDGPGAFVQTNLVGTFVMLSEARGYWQALDEDVKRGFRFHHISTDEVYGSLGPTGLFTEDTPYDPRSPYSLGDILDELIGPSQTETKA